MSEEVVKTNQSGKGIATEKEHKAANTPYRRAILQAIEALNDFQSRSNIDSVRRHVQATLTEQYLNDYKWNETLFLKTLKSVVQNGEIELCTNILAELSPSYKRKRADSLLAIQNSHLPQQTLLPVLIPNPPKMHIGPLKDPPKRPREHEKWKIIPKREYDKTIIVNPMDTH